MKDLLDTESRRILKLCHYLQGQPAMTSKNICHHCQSNFKTLQKDILTANDLISPLTLTKSTNSKYTLVIPPNYDLSYVHQQLLRHSQAYNIIETIFFRPHLSLRQLADRLFIDPITLRRSLKKINRILTKKDLKITLNPLKITGKKTNVMSFITALINEKYHPDGQPFSDTILNHFHAIKTDLNFPAWVNFVSIMTTSLLLVIKLELQQIQPMPIDLCREQLRQVCQNYLDDYYFSKQEQLPTELIQALINDYQVAEPTGPLQQQLSHIVNTPHLYTGLLSCPFDRFCHDFASRYPLVYDYLTYYVATYLTIKQRKKRKMILYFMIIYWDDIVQAILSRHPVVIALYYPHSQYFTQWLLRQLTQSPHLYCRPKILTRKTWQQICLTKITDCQLILTSESALTCPLNIPIMCSFLSNQQDWDTLTKKIEGIRRTLAIIPI